MLNKPIEFIFVCLTITVVFVSLPAKSVLANHIPAGFGVGSTIATPTGEVAIENLVKGDRVLGYNFETHRQEENLVKKIEQQTSLSYYLINGKTKIASTDLIYQKTLVSPELVRLNQIKSLDRLFGKKSGSVVAKAIEQIVEPTDVYQIILDNRIGNIYADDILIHAGFELPPYFRNHHVDCKPGTPYFKQCANVNAKSLPGFLAAIGIIALSLTLLDKVVTKVFKDKSN